MLRNLPELRDGIARLVEPARKFRAEGIYAGFQRRIARVQTLRHLFELRDSLVDLA
ncbi:MAG: hypothetical protein WDM89_01310 [Rhizomicrobium sp.]